jgi:C4-dicarboxylate-specific signal transduction histidine kinase
VRLRQVLINLLNNAADAMINNRRGDRRVIVKTSFNSRDNAVILSIIDNGAGFTEDSIAKVFRKHFTTKERGHGFGLLAVKRVIKNHKGKVWAEHNPSGGAIFSVQLPAETSHMKKDQPVNTR